MRSLVLGALGALALVVTMTQAPSSAEAAVYCRAVGVPHGCIARHVDRGFHGRPMNRGGPVNRVGRR
jgi:hypothetical protein